MTRTLHIKDYIGIMKVYMGKGFYRKNASFNFFCVGFTHMSVGFNLYFRSNVWIFGFRVPFGKWLYRKKRAKEQKLIDRLNKEDDLTGEYALQLDDWGCVKLNDWEIENRRKYHNKQKTGV